MNWLDLNGPIVADTVYYDGALSAKDVSLSLPAVTPTTYDYKAMGTMSLPMLGQYEDMEATITKIGVDLGLSRMIAPKSGTLEVRWVQDTLDATGAVKRQGCKAFLRAVPKGLPSLGLEPGSAPENELAFAVTRYQLFVGGEEFLLIDRLAQIVRIMGVDYYTDIASLL